MIYWPCALGVYNGKLTHLFTYDGDFTSKECEKTFRNWQSLGYILLTSWIHDDNGNIIEHNVYLDGMDRLIDLDGNLIPIEKKAFHMQRN